MEPGQTPKLGLVAPPDDRHLRKYGLTRETAPANPMPIDLGSDWYETWFHPWVDAQGNSWLVKPGTKPSDWGEIVGGHGWLSVGEWRCGAL